MSRQCFIIIIIIIIMAKRKCQRKRRRQRKNFRGAGLSHLKSALKNRGMQSAKRIGRHIFNQEMGKMFLIPALQPKYSSESQLVKNEINDAIKQFRKNPTGPLKHAMNLLRK